MRESALNAASPSSSTASMRGVDRKPCLHAILDDGVDSASPGPWVPRRVDDACTAVLMRGGLLWRTVSFEVGAVARKPMSRAGSVGFPQDLRFYPQRVGGCGARAVRLRCGCRPGPRRRGKEEGVALGAQPLRPRFVSDRRRYASQNGPPRAVERAGVRRRLCRAPCSERPAVRPPRNRPRRPCPRGRRRRPSCNCLRRRRLRR